METAIELHQLARVGAPLAAVPVRPPFPRATPQARGQHPPTEGFVMNGQAILARQVLGRQGRPKTLVHTSAVLVSNQPQRPLPHSRGRPSVGRLAHRSMLEPLRARLAVPSPEPFDLTVADTQHAGRRFQRQRPRLHPRHHFHTRQLPPTHRRPPHLATSTVASLRGHF